MLATEVGEILVLSPKNFVVVTKVQLAAAPVFMSIQGTEGALLYHLYHLVRPKIRLEICIALKVERTNLERIR